MSFASARLTVATIAAAAFPHGTPQDRSPLVEGAVAPVFACLDWQGERLDSSDLEGKPVLVFFHAPALSLSSRVFA